MTGSEFRKHLADEMVEQAKAFISSINGFADSEKCAVHWDDCDMDSRTFWFHFRPKISTSPWAVRLPDGCKRTGARVIGQWRRWSAALADKHGYRLTFERLHSPTEIRDGRGRFGTIKAIRPDYWCYRVTFYGGPDGVAIPRAT